MTAETITPHLSPEVTNERKPMTNTTKAAARSASRISWWSLTGFDSISDQIDDTIRAVGLTDDDLLEWIYDWVPAEIEAGLFFPRVRGWLQ